MKITKIRHNGTFPSHMLLVKLEAALAEAFSCAGFVTDVSIVNQTCIKTGLHMCSFKLDTNKHMRNLRNTPYRVSLTNIPTWDQRVEFNDIVNAILTKYNVSANVKSGPFTIRAGFNVFTESDWYDQKPEYILHNETRGYYIESVDEIEYLTDKRRLKKAKERANSLGMKVSA